MAVGVTLEALRLLARGGAGGGTASTSPSSCLIIVGIDSVSVVCLEDSPGTRIIALLIVSFLLSAVIVLEGTILAMLLFVFAELLIELRPEILCLVGGGKTGKWF